MSISLSKWPMLPTIALSFMRDMCSAVMTSKLPVAVMKMSAVSTTSSSAHDLVALHRRLQRADRVDLGDDDARALAAQRLRAALADLAEAGDDGELAAEHDVGRAAEAVGQRVAAAVDVVELRLRDRVVDVDRREQQRALLGHHVEAVDAGRRLLGDAAHVGREARVAARVGGELACAAGRAPRPTPRAASRRRTRARCRRQQLEALVQQHRGVAAVVDDQRRARAVRPLERLRGAPPVLLERLALPGEDRDAARVLGACRRSRGGRRRPPRRRGPASRRCCTRPSARRRRAGRASRSARRSARSCAGCP